MAYVSAETKARIAPRLREIARKHGVKATVAVKHNSTLVLNISSGKIDFINNHRAVMEQRPGKDASNIGEYMQVNPYWYKEHFTGDALAFLTEAITAMHDGNHDNSDIQTDYFDVGWYVNVNIGKWDKPYALVK